MLMVGASIRMDPSPRAIQFDRGSYERRPRVIIDWPGNIKVDGVKANNAVTSRSQPDMTGSAASKSGNARNRDPTWTDGSKH
jgi:hypothetical protein